MPFQKADVPKIRSFSLGDFHDFERCPFAFFVRHHLEKKYQLEEGSQSQTIGSLLDLGLKKYHNLSSLQQSEAVIPVLVSAAASQIKSEVEYNRSAGRLLSFYSSQLPFITPQVIKKAIQIFQNYHQGIKGKFKKAIHKNKLKPFWSYTYLDGEQFKLWGGGDGVELGDDGVAEIVDYKYFADSDKGRKYLDMDLMPKLYTLLAAQELLAAGYDKARFIVRLWQEPLNDSFYEEFDLKNMQNLANYFADKVRRIMGVTTLSFCEKDYCKVCKNEQREAWIKELEKRGWIKKTL